MNIATALLIALSLIDSGKPAKVVEVGRGQAIVILEGRPGCTAEGIPSSPVVFCKKPSR